MKNFFFLLQIWKMVLVYSSLSWQAWSLWTWGALLQAPLKFRVFIKKSAILMEFSLHMACWVCLFVCFLLICLGEFLLWFCLLDALCVSCTCVGVSFLNLGKIWSMPLTLNSSCSSMPVIQKLFFFHVVPHFLNVLFCIFFILFACVVSFLYFTFEAWYSVFYLIHSPEFLIGLLNFFSSTWVLFSVPISIEFSPLLLGCFDHFIQPYGCVFLSTTQAFFEFILCRFVELFVFSLNSFKSLMKFMAVFLIFVSSNSSR